MKAREVDKLAEAPGADARDALARVCTHDPEIKIRLVASEALLRAGDDRAIYGLATVVAGREHERMPRSVAEAAKLLGAHGDPAAVPALVAALDPSEAYENNHIASATAIVTTLGALGDYRAVDHIGPLLEIPEGTVGSHTVPIAAIDAIDRLGGPDAADWLLHVLHRGDDVRNKFGQRAIEALQKLGDPAAGEALGVVADGSLVAPRKVRRAAENAVRSLRDRPPLPTPDPTESPMSAAVAGFVVDVVGRRLREHPDPLERAAAARALGRLDDPRAVPVLQAAFRDPAPQVAPAVADACVALGGTIARNALLTGLRTASGPAQVACAAAMGDVVAEDPDGDIVDQLLADAAAGAAYPDEVRTEIAYALAQSRRVDARAAVETMIGQGIRLVAARTLSAVVDNGRRERLEAEISPAEQIEFVIDDGKHVLVGLADRLLHAHGRKVDAMPYSSIRLVDLGAHSGSAGAVKTVAMTAAFGIIGAAIASSSGGTAYVTITGDHIRYELKSADLSARAWTYLLELEDWVVGGAEG